jgi:hypothetical protein
MRQGVVIGYAWAEASHMLDGLGRADNDWTPMPIAGSSQATCTKNQSLVVL